MSAPHRDPTALPIGLFLIASAATAVVAFVLAVRRAPEQQRRAGPVPPAVALIASPGEGIGEEAGVFRTSPGMLALEPATRRERSAHPRTLRTVHFLRAFPGAPPRIPHNLSADEFRTDACRTCHQRGGFSVRFSAYVPVTPHPERGICLQCHVGVDSVIGALTPSADPNARCPMCHGSSGTVRPEASLTWETTVWPRLPALIRDQDPPPIPHDLRFRENCLTCHAGPAAVAELRTRHPDRAGCRQCHLVLDPEAGAFTREPLDISLTSGGAP